MARSTIEQDAVVNNITATDPVDYKEPSFAMASGMSIPVPSKMGSYWHEKINEAQAVYKPEHQKWDDIFDHYRRCGDEGKAQDGNGYTYKYNHKNATDENIIRTNIRTIMRTTYMRNPNLEFTASDTDDDLTTTLQYIISFLMNKQTHPGLNVKPKARRWIMHGQMTNFGIMRLDFQPKEGSLEEARANLIEIETKLQSAKSKDEIDELMAELQLLYDQMPLLEGKGMLLSNVLPHRVIVDPDCTHIDLSDAKWLAEECFLDRDYVDQKFYKKTGDKEWVMRSNEKHKKPESSNAGDSVEDTIIAKVMNDQTDERRKYVNKNKVRCWYVYDKITRRIYLFNSEDWKYPLWVYDDDLQLSRFFRHYIISFSEAIDGIVQPGEASFIVGQVNTINQINAKAQQIRNSVFGALLYDPSMIDKDEVKKLVHHLNNPREVEAFAVKKGNGEQKKISDMVEVFAPPAMQYADVFQTQNLRSVINKTNGLSDVDQGEQFKTNTNTSAVDYMAENKQANTGMIIDNIEDSFEALGWSMAEVIVSKYTVQDITELVGPEYAAKFQPMTVIEFNQRFRMTIAAGSIEKPTTEFKKKEAIQIAQALGQLGQGAPATTLKLIIKMFQTAFSNFVMKKKDWEELDTEAQANLTKGQSVPGQPPAANQQGVPPNAGQTGQR